MLFVPQTMVTLQKTLAIFKPDVLKNGYTEIALERIHAAGFSVLCNKIVQLDKFTVMEFYQEHVGKDFFPSVAEYMTR